ncbi:hypothetical protein ACFODT_11260 [Vibrio zhugei]|uniref:Uncharacterized protein n=1 Tax=Vibrio zhugei TaxID=2479546 RepID=A0ABV7C8N1_9VIBR|nr:hypothetical protein [Vibrio zhugei]
MFGIKQMKRQRDTLYCQTKQWENIAAVCRKQAKDRALQTASSPQGLLVSFLLGATTQTDLATHARRNLLSRATRDVFSFLSAQMMASMAKPSQADTPSDADSSVGTE